VEQDRTSPVLPHHAELAQSPARKPPRRGRADRRDNPKQGLSPDNFSQIMWTTHQYKRERKREAGADS
jgi:hypothetical protein